MKLPTIIAIAILSASPAWAQSGQNGGSKQHPKASPHKILKLSGEVSADGQTFTADHDGAIWQVSNPDAFRGMSGRHVIVKANLDPAGNGIQVLGIQAYREDRTNVKFDDAAFRR
jgi:hypothetical protein